MIEVDEITGVFVGQWPEDRKLYAIYYTEEGHEYLARMDGLGAWMIVSWKDKGGDETANVDPVIGPHPVTIAYDLIADRLLGEDIII